MRKRANKPDKLIRDQMVRGKANMDFVIRTDLPKRIRKYKRMGECNQCGYCCKHYIAILGDNPVSDHFRTMWPDNIKFYKDEEIGVEYEIFAAELPCVNLDEENLCLLYDVRPDYCKTFPVRPDDPVWQFIKDKCSYYFVEVDENGEELERDADKVSK